MKTSLDIRGTTDLGSGLAIGFTESGGPLNALTAASDTETTVSAYRFDAYPLDLLRNRMAGDQSINNADSTPPN